MSVYVGKYTLLQARKKPAPGELDGLARVLAILLSREQFSVDGLHVSEISCFIVISIIGSSTQVLYKEVPGTLKIIHIHCHMFNYHKLPTFLRSFPGKILYPDIFIISYPYERDLHYLIYAHDCIDYHYRPVENETSKER